MRRAWVPALLSGLIGPALALAQPAANEGVASTASKPAQEPAGRSEASSARLAPGAKAGADPGKSWRAHDALGLPWLRFGLEHRSRFEHLENDFRSSNPGDATAVSLRTLLSAELRFLSFVVGAELQDSRAWAAEGTPLNTTIVNPVEILQAHGGLRAESAFTRGDTLSITAGRFTLDIGSRRLVARNEFRNTINAFTGLDLQWASPERGALRFFFVVPVVRLPSEAAELAEGRIELDRENTAAVLWGAFFQSPPLAAKVVIEAYVLGLHERDGELAPSANRRLVTPGVRVLRAPAPGRFDFQLEVMGQLGRSRAGAAVSDVADLDHLAFSFHASGGYRFDVPWSPRVVLQLDHASGDRDPRDGTNGRFDPLFGARRFELGPTGLYGAFAWSNLGSPGLRVELQPHRTVDAFAAYRPFWLASARDAWTTAGLRDASGKSGRFVGQQIEGRVRWHAFPGNLALDLGGALLFRGDFAPPGSGADKQPSAFVYTQLTATL